MSRALRRLGLKTGSESRFENCSRVTNVKSTYFFRDFVQRESPGLVTGYLQLFLGWTVVLFFTVKNYHEC